MRPLARTPATAHTGISTSIHSGDWPQRSIEMSQIKGAPARAQVNRTIKGTQVFWHDLFKSNVQKMIKCIFNRSDEKGVGQQKEEDLKLVEHVHFFHSHDSQGRAQTTCVSVGGHYHKIITHDNKGNPLVDAHGRPRVECGPPLRKVKVKRGKKMVSVEEPVTFGMEDGKMVADKHTHDFSYIDSQELSPDKMEQLKRGNAKGILAAFDGAPQLKGTEPVQTNDKDTATIS